MDAQGNVVDSSKVEAGSGRTVKGLNGYEGEITGNPARNSKFTRLQIGMSARQVTDLAGQPTDQGAYVTGKAFIPVLFRQRSPSFRDDLQGPGTADLRGRRHGRILRRQPDLDHSQRQRIGLPVNNERPAA
jgi:hypothetical protein